MRRFVIRALVAVGVLAAAAVVEFSPHATAGYLSVSAPAASASLGSVSRPDSDPEPSPVAHRLNLHNGLPIVAPQQSGGMSSTGSTTGGVDSPTSGVVARTELPVDGMTQYFREPEVALDLTRFVDSILDPPRGL